MKCFLSFAFLFLVGVLQVFITLKSCGVSASNVLGEVCIQTYKRNRFRCRFCVGWQHGCVLAQLGRFPRLFSCFFTSDPSGAFNQRTGTTSDSLVHQCTPKRQAGLLR